MRIRTIIIFALIVAVIAPAFAQVAGIPGVRGLGLGVILGEPTGFNVKLLISPQAAFDIGLAWSFTDATRPGFSFVVYADYLYHFFGLVRVPVGQLGFYCGVGGLLNVHTDALALCLRIPLGLAYVFENVPLDVFIELVPGMQIIPETRFAGFGGIGIRYWFKW
jgi:hypothetical protein